MTRRDNISLHLKTMYLMLKSLTFYTVIVLFIVAGFSVCIFATELIKKFGLTGDDFFSVSNFLVIFTYGLFLFVSIMMILFIFMMFVEKYMDIYNGLYTDFDIRLSKKMFDYVVEFHMYNGGDNKTVYVSKELYRTVKYSNLFGNVEVDIDRVGISIGFSKKNEVVDKVKSFFEYE